MRHFLTVHAVILLTFATAPVISCTSASETATADAEKSPATMSRTPPGAKPYSPELRGRLSAALKGKGTGYEPRTHHLDQDGAPHFTNRLILETSPYLLQHAHNPVDWYPWGDEAFLKAEKLGRPVILSVGYSTCHWCHVMERESFEDLEIARFMNERFIAIKVDREERPDVDSVYMSAVRVLSGQGGWPMTLVLTPDRRPFFGGTYFPARAGDRGVRKGFIEILRELDELYRNDPDGVVANATATSRRVAQALAGRPPGKVPGADAVVRAATILAGSFDPVNGGFGGGRKFPRPVTLELLLRYHRRTGDPGALAMVERTLERMAAGGIHDQVGGGFHRYTVEPTWLVPHFEKMLYDNAQLAVVYLEAFQVTGREEFAEVARRTLDYLMREMSNPGGGFYSATDADSPAPSGHDEEGWFFTWTPEEVRQAVGEKLAPLTIAWFGVTERGNFDGRNILRVHASIDTVAAQTGVPPAHLVRAVDEARARLYTARSRRPPPITDTKVVVAWNGLALSAFARGAAVLGEERFRDRAVRGARYLLAECRKDGRLYRTCSAVGPGVLSDYAFLTAGLLDLYEATFDPRWLEEAIALQGTLDARFADRAGGYFMTADDAEKLLAREKPDYDGAEPSGNSFALLNLMRLYEFTGDERYAVSVRSGLAAFATTLAQNPSAVPMMMSALDFHLDRPKEIVLVAPGGPDAAAPFLEVLAGRFLPNRVVIFGSDEEEYALMTNLTPLLENRTARDGLPTAYVCEGRVCKFPTTDPAEFARQISHVAPYEGVTPAPLQPASTPAPWEYDQKRNRHWNPGHRHWHEGPPPPESGRG